MQFGVTGKGLGAGFGQAIGYPFRQGFAVIMNLCHGVGFKRLQAGHHQAQFDVVVEQGDVGGFVRFIVAYQTGAGVELVQR